MAHGPRYLVLRAGPDLPANYLRRELDGRWYGMPAFAGTAVAVAGMVLLPTAEVEYRDDGAAAIVYEAHDHTAEQSVRYENRVVVLPDRHDWLYGGADPEVSGLELDRQVAISRRYMRIDRGVELAVMVGARIVATAWLRQDRSGDYDTPAVQREFIDLEQRAAWILARWRTPANSRPAGVETAPEPRSDEPVTTP